jgi:hypothetical protein
VGGGESPDKIFPGKTSLDVLVFSNILVVIEISKIIFHPLPKHNQDGQDQQKAD